MSDNRDEQFSEGAESMTLHDFEEPLTLDLFRKLTADLPPETELQCIIKNLGDEWGEREIEFEYDTSNVPDGAPWLTIWVEVSRSITGINIPETVDQEMDRLVSDVQRCADKLQWLVAGLGPFSEP